MPLINCKGLVTTAEHMASETEVNRHPALQSPHLIDKAAVLNSFHARPVSAEFRHGCIQSLTRHSVVVLPGFGSATRIVRLAMVTRYTLVYGKIGNILFPVWQHPGWGPACSVWQCHHSHPVTAATSPVQTYMPTHKNTSRLVKNVRCKQGVGWRQ